MTKKSWYITGFIYLMLSIAGIPSNIYWAKTNQNPPTIIALVALTWIVVTILSAFILAVLGAYKMQNIIEQLNPKIKNRIIILSITVFSITMIAISVYTIIN